MVHLHHDVAYPVEEISVMGDHQQRTPRAAKIALEEFDGIDVEVVGRLVHDEELSLACQHLGQCYALYFSSGKLLHLLIRIRKIEAGEELHDPMLIFPESLLIEPCCEIMAGRHYLFEYALLRIEFIFLFQKGYLYVLQEHYLSAGIRLVLSCKNPHERSLACAVRSNEGDLVALIDIESYLFEKHLRSVAFRYVLDL